MNAWPPKPGCTLMNSRMSISSRYGQHRVERRLGVVHEPDPHPVGAHPVEQRPRVAELDVDGARVRAGLGEVVEQVPGVVDHQVAVEVEVRARAQALHHRRADGEVRHEVAVHHVDVQQVRLRADRASTSLASSAKSADRIDGAIFPMRPEPSGGTVRARGSAPRTYMPSVPGGLRAAGSAPRPQATTGVPGGGSATKSGSARRAHSSTSTVSAAVSVHTEYTSRPPGPRPSAPRRRAARAGARRARRPPSARSASGPPDGGAARRGPSTARRAARGRTTPARNGSAPPVRRRPGATDAQPEPGRGAGDERRADRHGRRPRRRARGRPSPRPARSPSRPARRRPRARARPVARRPRAATAWLAWSWGVARPSATAGDPAGVAAARARPARRAASAPRSTPRPARDAARPRPSAGRPGARFDPQRQRGRLVRDLERGARVLAAEVGERAGRRSSRASTSGRRPRSIGVALAATATAGRASATRAQHRVDVALGPRRDPRRARRRSRRRPRAARRPRPAGRPRGAARPRTGGVEVVEVAVEHRLEQRVERPAPAQRAVDEVGRLRRARGAPGPVARRSSGSRTLAYAPSSTRTRASRATLARRRRRHANGADAAVPGPPRGVRHRRACPRAGPRRARSGRRRRAPRHTFSRLPSTTIHAPGRGLPAARPGAPARPRSPLGVELELVDGELLGVRRLTRPAASAPRPGSRAACAAAGRCRCSTSRSCSSPAVSLGIDRSACGREHRAGVETGLDRHDVDTRSPRRRRGSPARPAPRPASAAATRSAGSRTRAGAPRAARSGSSWPNATTTPSSAPVAAHLVDDLPRPLGRRDREAELLGGRLHRARDERTAAAALAVGLGDDERDLVAGVVQRAQRRDRVGRRPEVDDAHARSRLSRAGGRVRRHTARLISWSRMALSAFLRSSGSTRSIARMPSRWSISCWNIRPR